MGVFKTLCQREAESSSSLNKISHIDSGSRSQDLEKTGEIISRLFCYFSSSLSAVEDKHGISDLLKTLFLHINFTAMRL